MSTLVSARAPTRTAFWLASVLLLAATAPLLMTPSVAQPESPLVVVGDHQLTILRASRDGATSVMERLHLSSDEAYSGVLWIDLPPQVTRLTHSFERADGSPLGLAGAASRDPLPNETVGEHIRHRIDLAERNVTIGTDQVVVLRLNYILPSDVNTFTRGFTLETPRLATVVGHAPGLVPVSESTPLEPSAFGPWMFTLRPGAEGPFSPGERFAFTWEEHPVPQVPLSVRVAAAGSDPLIVTATASGGIPPYSYSWDTDGDGECDDHDGASVQIDTTRAGTHAATVCVTDSAVPQGSVEQTYETRTVFSEGAWDGPSPWLLLVFGLLVGALFIFGLSRVGVMPGPGPRGGAVRDAGPSFGAEARDLLETRQRVMVAALKELEIARKKGEVGDDVYTPLKAELKRDTVRVMRELERRKEETV